MEQAAEFYKRRADWLSTQMEAKKISFGYSWNLITSGNPPTGASNDG